MKPIVTWVVLGNARDAKVLANSGPGKGLSEVNGAVWQADEANEARDRAGMGHSIGGPGVSAVDKVDQQLKSETEFAKTLAQHLSKAFDEKQFQRLIIVAGPHMLGLLRAALDPALSAALVGEVAKDLSAQPNEAIEAKIGEIIAV